MIEKYSHYEFQIYRDEEDSKHWLYRIYISEHKPSKNTILRESDEWFDTEQEARFAAIGHISALEEGER